MRRNFLPKETAAGYHGFMIPGPQGERGMGLGGRLGLGAWGLALSLGALIAARALFPQQEIPAVDGEPAADGAAPAPSRDAPASVAASVPGRTLPLTSLSAGPASIPTRRPATASAAAGDGPVAERASPLRAVGPQPLLAASAGPAGWAGAASRPFLSQPPRQARKESLFTRSPWSPRASAAGRAPAGATAMPTRSSLPASDPAASAATQGGTPPFGSAALTQGSAAEAGASPQAFPQGPQGELLFEPRAIQNAGGRLGQGAISMEGGQGVTEATLDPRAEGLGAVAGKQPAGPKLPAGAAPAIPSSEVPLIIRAALEAGIDPGLLAATAARESNFGVDAYRAEPHLSPVLWRKSPGAPQASYLDGSLGPTQVLRSNFIARGIDDEEQAYDLANNYRVGASIIRDNLDAFPGDEWKAVAAYNVGQYGARLGRVPPGNYTDTILAWRNDYAEALKLYLP